MQFNLPENLKHQLVNYDPVLKKELKVKKASNPNAKPKKQSEFPLGQVENLIPTNIVSAESQTEAIRYINQAELTHRVKHFTKRVLVKDGSIEGGVTLYTEEIVAFIFHYESAWYSAWLPQGEDVGKYLYGFTVAFKDGAKAAERARACGFHSQDKMHIEPQHKKFGRSNFVVYSHKVTMEDIENNRCGTECWNIAGIYQYYQKCVNIWPAVKRFKDAYHSTIPRWVDSYNIYDRLDPKKNTLLAILKEIAQAQDLPVDFYPTVESMLSLVNPDVKNTEADDNAISYSPAYRWLPAIKHAETYKVLNTPFFRNWIQSKCDQIIHTYEDKSNNVRKKIVHGFVQYRRVATWITFITKVWPDTPVDFFRTSLQEMLFIPPVVDIYYRDNKTEMIEWLRTHMPVASLFKIMSTTYNKKMEEIQEAVKQQGFDRVNRRYEDENMGIWTISTYNEIRDTFSMLDRVITAQVHKGEPLIQPPNRWRISEFHDHVQAESWKMEHENIVLPQDLFPQPVKVELDEKKWSFFQPMNTHQLAAWGQAVRNCVGSHSNYADGVRKKEHFIVLGMLDGQPRFTIQLRVRSGVMDVLQIKAVSNSSLSREESDQYTQAFSIALKKRSEELLEVTAEEKVLEESVS